MTIQWMDFIGRELPNGHSLGRITSSVLSIITVVGLTWVHSASAATFHVATTGNDVNSGTLAQPWGTIGKANMTLVAGDTVLIHAGRYSDQLRPVNSGTSDANRIVYRAAGDGIVILDGYVWSPRHSGLGAVALGERSYVTVSGRAPGGPDTDQWLHIRPTASKETLYGNFTGSTGCIVENVYMKKDNPGIGPNRGWAFSDYWYKDDFYTSTYNVLRHCTIHGTGPGTDPVEYTEDTITMAQDAHHNLIEHCYIGESKHVSLNQNQADTHSNVFRNNTVDNPSHTAQSIYGSGTALKQYHHLIENCVLIASGETSNPPGGPGNALQFSAHESIVRYNLITEGGAVTPTPAASTGGLGASSSDNGPRMSDNRFYNNSIVHHNPADSVLSIRTFNKLGREMGRNRFWNNFVYENMRTGGLVGYWRGGDDGRDRYVRNIFGNPGGSASEAVIQVGHGRVPLATAVANYRNPEDPEFTAWNGFANVYDPDLDSGTFQDYAGKDYRLKATSSYVDAGAPLTVVAAADTGNGTTLVVDDSRFVYAEAGEFPAWMGIQCDWIAVGLTVATAAKVRIAGADDDRNTITLANQIARSDGDFVWLWKDTSGRQVVHGSAPDIGAFEFNGGVQLPAAPSNLKRARP